VCADLGILSLLLGFMSVAGPYTGMLLLLALFFSFGLFQPGTLMFVQIKEIMPLRMAGTAMTGINFFTMVGAAFFLQGLGGLMQSLILRRPEACLLSHGLYSVCSLHGERLRPLWVHERHQGPGKLGGLKRLTPEVKPARDGTQDQLLLWLTKEPCSF